MTDEPQKKSRPKWRIWLRRILLGLLGLVLLVVATLALALFTSTGTGLLLRAGASIYSGMIPGEVDFDDTQGALANAVTLHEVSIRDRNGNLMIDANRLELGVDVGKLFGLTIDAGLIELDGASVDLGGRFEDLAPTGPPKPKPPRDTVGPNLPFEIIARLRGRDLEVRRGQNPLTLVRLLELEFWAAGTEATVELEAGAAVPVANLDVHALSLRARWSDPSVELPVLALQTTEGDVWVTGLKADFEAMRFELESLKARVDTERLPSELAGSTLVVRGGGTLDALSLDAAATAPLAGSLTLMAEGGIAEQPWARVNADAELLATETLPALSLRLDASGAGDLSAGLDAQVYARCDGCDADVGPLELFASGRAAPNASIVRVDADLASESLNVHVDGAGSSLAGGAASASVRVPDLAKLEPVIHRFAPDLELRGEVKVDAWCIASVWPQFGLCRANGGIERGAPVEHAGFDVSAGFQGARIGALVHRLDARQGPARLEMGPEIGKVLYTPEAVSVESIVARAGTNTGMGTIAIDGMLGLTEASEVQAHVRVSDLSLSTIDRFVPDLDASGRLTANVTLDGSLADPRLDAHVRGRRLDVLSVDIGDLDLDARYGGRDLSADLDVSGGELGTIELRGRVPVKIDAQAGQFELDARGSSSVRLSVHDARLETARKFVPALETLRGSLDLEFEQSGSIRAPRLSLETAIREGAYDAHVLPDLAARLQYADRRADAEVFATHPEAFDRLSITALAPVSLDLARGKVRLRPDEDLQVQLDLENLDLAYARKVVPDLETEGQVSLHAELGGNARAPTLEATLDAKGLAWQGRPAGEVALSASYADDRATAKLWAAGPDVSGIGIDASVPVSMDLVALAPQWHPELPHEVDVAINEALVHELITWIPGGPQLDLKARTNALVQLHGTAQKPRITLHTEVEDVTYGGREAGRIELDANYEEASAHAELDYLPPSGHPARMEATVPVELALVAGTASWNRNGQHELRLAIPRLDPQLLEPFIDAGSFDGAFAVHAVGSGSFEKFETSLSARGSLNGQRARLPIDARVVIKPELQTVSLDVGNALRVRAQTEANVPGLVDGGDWREATLEAKADIDGLDLSTLSAFLPTAAQNVRGVLDMHVSASGRIGKPTFDGALKLENAEVTVVPARVRLTDLDVDSTFSQDGLTLDRLAFRAGDGRGSASGTISIQRDRGVTGELSLELKEFPLRAPGLPRMALSTKVGTNLFLSTEETDVKIRVGTTLVDVYTSRIAAADPIPTNERVVMVDLSEPGETPEPTSEEGPPSPKHIRVDLTEEIRIIGPSIDMRWGGAVEATVTEDGTTTNGRLQAGRGMFALFGNEFDLEQGTVYLPEESDGVTPFVDVTATTTVEDVSITATVKGPASRPEFELSSVPAYPQSEIFTILVTGTTDTQSADSDDVQDKAAAVLAAVSNGPLQRQLRDTLKVDKVGVGFGDSSDQPILSVGKNITRDIYAETEYHHNAPPNENRAQLEVEYEFAPRWSLETFFGDAAQGGVDLFWGFAFNTEKNADEASAQTDPSG